MKKDKPDVRREPPALDANIQRHIGRHLRAMFEEVASQPVPDRFLDLLDQLESKTEPGAQPGSTESVELTK